MSQKPQLEYLARCSSNSTELKLTTQLGIQLQQRLEVVVGIEQVQFDNDAVPLRSDLRVLATIRFPGEPDRSIYIDSDGPKEGVKRTDYISATLEPKLFKRDEVSIISNWPRFGGPHVVVLPEGQRLLLGQLPQGATVDVALWRKFIMAQTFSNRILVTATPDGVAAFQARPGSATTLESEQIYRDSKQEKEVQEILNSISEDPVKTSSSDLTEVSVSPPYIEVPHQLEKLEEIANELAEMQPKNKIESLPEPEPEPEPEPKPEPEPVGTIAPVVYESAKPRSRKSTKAMTVLSDALITLAIFATISAGYQTIWSIHVSQQNTSEARAEVEQKWAEDPAAEPELHKSFALIYIPRLKDKVWELPITRGVDPEDLISGLGHYPDKALPGEKGNFALAGFRATYGEPFANIDQLKKDDEVIIQTAGNWYVYKLVLAEIVEPDAVWVLDDNPSGVFDNNGVEEIVTLTTSHPSWGSTERWIWWGVLTEVRPYDQVPESIAATQEAAVQ